MTPIDRRALVGRHDVRVAGLDPTAALSVGNGELCFTTDVTGLQTLPAAYRVADPGGGEPGTLLGTLSQWAWHSTPAPDGADLAAATRRYTTPRGPVPYVDSPDLGPDESGLPEGLRWLRANPHRLDLFRAGLVVLDGGDHRAPDAHEVSGSQHLDLWHGVLTSECTVAGRRLRVTTACHPTRDAVAVRVEHDGGGPVGVRVAFPYGSEAWANAARWDVPGAHVSSLERDGSGELVRRAFDGSAATHHVVRLWTGRGTTARQVGPHELLLTGGATLEVVLEPRRTDGPCGPLTVARVLTAARARWPAFWRSGAAVDLSGSTDPRADELERRIVLSQYLTAIGCAGSLPPAETGLVTNSWRGRFHLEMHYWHAAHFAAWGRPDLLARSMSWYGETLPVAVAAAARQGYRGARWPKQVGPDGRESPSHIGPFLLWQQPHVIHLAELLRRAGSPGALERYAPVVLATAELMADLAEPDGSGGYGLGPPLVPAQESYASIRDRARDPTFELVYWRWALRVAQEWRSLLGLAPAPAWADVADNLHAPTVRDGVYAALAVDPWTVRTDHPSMLFALGLVPDVGIVDHDVMRTTLLAVLDDWDASSMWGWDLPAVAMTAARLGEPALAVDALLRDYPKNRFAPNGHNPQHDALPVYLPGNGALLLAVALMAGGWEDDGGTHAPGFPADGRWVVRHEGLVRSH